MVDLRRESLYIDKHQAELQGSIGHTVLWRCHLPGQDDKDPIYGVAGPGGIAWSDPFDVPVIWIDNAENTTFTADRRDITSTVRLTLSMSQLEASSSMADPHDWRERTLDIFHWRGRWYKVTQWNIQNLLGSDDKNVYVVGAQQFPEQDFVNTTSVGETDDYNPGDSADPLNPSDIGVRIVL